MSKQKTLTFEAVEEMTVLEFMGKKWKKTRNDHACECEFSYRNFVLHFAFFGGSDDTICATLAMKRKVKKEKISWDVQESWGKTINGALRDLEGVLFQIAVLTRR
jgi:hypothetical protein